MAEDEGLAATSARLTKRGRRGRLSTFLAVILVFTLAGGLVMSWVENTVFDGREFAARGVQLLDSTAVRSALAEEMTEALVENGPSQLASFRTVLTPVLEGVIATDAFKEIFRRALEEAHRTLFTQDGNDFAANVSDSLAVLTASLAISNPEVANRLPSNLDVLLVDLSDDIRAIEASQFLEDLEQTAVGLLMLSIVLGVAIVALDHHPRRGVFKIGAALVAAGLLVVLLTLVVPGVVAGRVDNATLAPAVRSGVSLFLGDLQTLGVWFVGYGVVAAALATASAPTRAAVDPRALWAVASERWSAWQPASPGWRGFRAVLIIAAGIVVILQRDLVVPVAIALLGAYLSYVGVVQLLMVVGRTKAERATTRAAAALAHDGHDRRSPKVLAAAGALALVVSLVGVLGTRAARSEAAPDRERRCNGSAELCDRQIDQVAFAGSHNSMSASHDPGWLFAENRFGIPSQLEYGIRALLVKTHYGIPSGIDVTGAPLVVTDRAAEIAVNPAAAEQQLPAGTAADAQSMAASARVDPSKRDIYLCHVYCEYGATRFATALQDIKRFLTHNPNEVIIFFIGDYVSIDDTYKAFQDAGLADRLYPYDPAAPPPTLGQMIEARQNIFMLSEFTGQPPGWNNPGYGLFQDTPYTFRDPAELVVEGAAGDEPSGTTVDTGYVDDTTVAPDTALRTGTTLAWAGDWTGEASCAPNRGTPDSPLFQINHWVTPAGAASTVAQARRVNAYDVLMPRVRACMRERGRFPTIVGVNFYDQGDLLEVVDDLNGVTVDR